MGTFTLSRRTAAFVATTAAVTAVSMTTAVASPPVPLVTKLQDLARAQLTEGGSLPTPAGTDAVISMYTLAPGTTAGWRSAPGMSVYAVTKGVLTLIDAKGCTRTEYPAGKAAMVPRGRYLVENGGSEPLEFAGVFVKLAKGAQKKPLLDGPAGSAPAACKATGYGVASTSLPEVADYTRGTMVPKAAYGDSLHALHAGAIPVEAGKDVSISSFSFLPGFRSGWITHVPALNIMTRGTLDYYEGRDGACVKAESYTPGQAFTHVGGVHMATNDGAEPAEGIVVWFNLPHNGSGAIPTFGSLLDEVDFTPLPPADCPRLF